MGNTPAELEQRMKARLVNPASRMEGSFSADNIQALANELGRLYSEDYDRLIQRSHVSTAHGEDLDLAAKDNHRMERNGASYEQVTLLFTGEPGTVVDENVGAYVDQTVFRVNGVYEIGEDGTCLTEAVCTRAGSGNRVPAGAVNRLLESYPGITGVTNPEASSGGYDEESDEDFRRRVMQREADYPGYGNIAWYRETAKEITGVAKAKVFDCARGSGTVDVVIVAAGNQPAPQILVDRVKEHIEETRIAGADVLVESGASLRVKVEAAVYLSSFVSLASVKEEFAAKLGAYMDSIEFISQATQSRVSLAKVTELLLGCTGVMDIDVVTLNGAVSSVVLDARSFPLADEPALTLAG